MYFRSQHQASGGGPGGRQVQKTISDGKLAGEYGNLSRSSYFEGVRFMQWTTPQFEEIALNCEINSYASAAL
jgi:coenzyme PQQ precursor peptide PqqA